MESQEFTQLVLDRSHSIPVLVDFWAPWCGPCQVLGPAIEELAQEAQGKWELVKINVDESKAVAGTYKIMSIPTVMLFVEGKPLEQFAGALPKYQIQQWLNEHLPDERKKDLQRLQTKLQGDLNGKVLKELEAFVDQHPNMEEAKLLLSREILTSSPEKAKELIQEIKIGHKLYDQAGDVRNLIDLMEDSPPEGTDIATCLSEAREAFSQKDYDGALTQLIKSLQIDKSYGEELARRACIAIFHLLGESHELTRKHRPLFGMALY